MGINKVFMRWGIFILSLFVFSDLLAQKDKSMKGGAARILQQMIVEGDTMYLYNMPEIKVNALRAYKDEAKEKQFKKIKFHVKKVYPLAKFVSRKLNEYRTELNDVGSNRKKRKYLKNKENKLKSDFEETIRKMSVTRGRVLMKLIDRETGTTSYEIIKEYRGGFRAFMYQNALRLYGSSLKQKYDPNVHEEDEMIERVVRAIEGQ